MFENPRMRLWYDLRNPSIIVKGYGDYYCHPAVIAHILVEGLPYCPTLIDELEKKSGKKNDKYVVYEIVCPDGFSYVVSNINGAMTIGIGVNIR